MADPSASPTPLKVTTSFQCSPQMKHRLEEGAAREGVSQQQIIQRALVTYFERLDRRAWGTEDGDAAYDPTRYYTFGSDSKGHSVELRVTIPKPLRGELQRLIESGAIPEYHTAQHVARDAIYHRVKMLSRMLDDGQLERAVDLAILLSEEEALQARESEARLFIDTVRDNLQMLTARGKEHGDYGRLAEYLETRSGKTEIVPEGYRAEYETMLKDYRRIVRESRRKKIEPEG